MTNLYFYGKIIPNQRIEVLFMTAPNNICIYADPFPDGELHCLAYSEAKYPNGKMNMHFPVCSNKNCPLRNPKLLNGGKLNV